MKQQDWLFYIVAGLLVLIYFVGEATGYLFFAMLIILPVGIWVLNKLADGPER